MVWDHEYSATDRDIHGQSLEVDGNKVGGCIAIATSMEDDTHPAVATNGATGEWMVVWQRASTEGAQIRGALGQRADFLYLRGSGLDVVGLKDPGRGRGHPRLSHRLRGGRRRSIYRLS